MTADPLGMTADDMARARRVLMRRDPVLAPIIKKYGACGIKTGRESDIFCGLVEAIVSQQLSTRAAATIYGRLRALLPNGGTPTPEALLPLSDEALRGVGLSRQKLGYMRDLSRKMLDGSINTDRPAAHERRRDRRGTDENQRNWPLDGRDAADFPADASRCLSGGRSWYCEGGSESLQPSQDAGRQTVAEDRRAMAAVPLGGLLVFVGQPGE